MRSLKEKDRVTAFQEFMKVPGQVTPIVPMEMMDWLEEKGFFRAPASTKYHGA